MGRGRVIMSPWASANVKCNNDYGVQNDESLRGHCTNEKSQKRDKKVRRDVI